ncbi:dienelactone hydrolase family protein [Ferruginivarius sediminum]|uniref:Alpha/beta hydrolase n=1 Tax=Ferruginivarius sediminum TaxID=2661937 RepID=A0A369TC31_9PROT|nr:alpha/beta family hydrolase [Ferruginivarius sediminum]RDD62838.1 alpha/beta hydrolase [Ferruginivarius sediminum]
MTETPAPIEQREVVLPPVELPGILSVPAGAQGLVVFAHGSGSSRLSPRNTYVAEVLQRAGLATLLFDLLTETEGLDRHNVFDIPLLGERLESAAGWITRQPDIGSLSLGLFGASTGAAAALVAAARLGTAVGAVVSRGGRPDLAAGHLEDVRAPTLLIVGGRDEAVLQLNRNALARLTCAKELRIVEGATHLFEEPDTLGEVCRHARDWFVEHLKPSE